MSAAVQGQTVHRSNLAKRMRMHYHRQHALVNWSAYMNFREATDSLFSRVDHEELAKVLGVSVAAIRQARLRPDASAHRPPPAKWRQAVLRLARERAGHYQRLAGKLAAEERLPGQAHDTTSEAPRTDLPG
jgi:hypothetical protein